MTKEELKQITDVVADKTLLCSKEVLTLEETSRYMGVSKSYLYKLTMKKQIPHYKPMGKVCFFNRLEIEQFLQNNRVCSQGEIKSKALNHCMKGGVL